MEHLHILSPSYSLLDPVLWVSKDWLYYPNIWAAEILAPNPAWFIFIGVLWNICSRKPKWECNSDTTTNTAVYILDIPKWWNSQSTLFELSRTVAMLWSVSLRCNETVHQLFIDFKIACDSVRKEVLYNFLVEFGLPMKVGWLKYV
jgi:hypothetical protein